MEYTLGEASKQLTFTPFTTVPTICPISHYVTYYDNNNPDPASFAAFNTVTRTFEVYSEDHTLVPSVSLDYTVTILAVDYQ